MVLPTRSWLLKNAFLLPAGEQMVVTTSVGTMQVGMNAFFVGIFRHVLTLTNLYLSLVLFPIPPMEATYGDGTLGLVTPLG